MTEKNTDSGNSLADSTSESFFDSLENDVNGAQYDTPLDTSKPQGNQDVATQDVNAGPDVATQQQAQPGQQVENTWESDDNPYKKRYSDSSKEAVKLREQYKSVEDYVPVLDAMKNDSGLVDHVRTYLENGGKPKGSIQEQLGLDEDFIFDEQEAMTNPDSDSAKVQNAHVNAIVESRMKEFTAKQQETAQRLNAQQTQNQQKAEFMARTGMTEEQFSTMQDQAKNHTLTLDDIHYLMNRGQTQQNIQNNAQNDMRNQMRGVRNMPTSNGTQNNVGETNSTEEQVFDNIFGIGSTKATSLFG